MAWWIIIDAVLDKVDEWTNHQKVVDKKDKESQAKQESGGGFPRINLKLANIFGWLTSIAFSLVQIIDVLKGTSVEGVYDGDGTTKYSGSDILNTALGKQVDVISKYGSDRSWNRSVAQRVAGNTKHMGVDLEAKQGDTVYAPMTGIIIGVNKSNSGTGGRSVTILSDDKTLRVFMCHFSTVSVHEGQRVTAGQLVATVGGSGKGKDNAYTPHLHLETKVLKNGKYVYTDPESLRSAISETSASPNLVLISRNTKNSHGRPTNFKELAAYAVDTLSKKLSLKDYQAAGLVGNLIRESGLKTSAHNPAGGRMGARGVAQWRGDRITRYKEKYGKLPNEDNNFANHIGFIIWELQNTHSVGLQKLRQASNVTAAADAALGYYEFSAGTQAAVKSLGLHGYSSLKRGRVFAREALNLYRASRQGGRGGSTTNIFNSSSVTLINNESNRRQ